MVKTHRVSTYRVINISGKSYDESGSSSRTVAVIDLFDDVGTKCGAILFLPNGAPLRDPVFHAPSSQIYLFYHWVQLPVIVDILRNEDPVHIYYSSTPVGYLYTGLEPVGEEEASHIP